MFRNRTTGDAGADWADVEVVPGHTDTDAFIGYALSMVNRSKVNLVLNVKNVLDRRGLEASRYVVNPISFYFSVRIAQ